MAEAAIAHTVLEAMIAIGIENVALFDGQTQGKRIAEGIFEDDLSHVSIKLIQKLTTT